MAFDRIKNGASKLKDETPKPTIEGTVYSIVFGATAVVGLLTFGVYKLLAPERVLAKKAKQTAVKAKATVEKHREHTDD